MLNFIVSLRSNKIGMPRTQSAKKALRLSLRRRETNLDRKIKMKTVIKEYKKLIAAGKTEEAKNYLPKIYKTLDKLVKVDFIKSGKVNRLKSRLTKKLVIK